MVVGEAITHGGMGRPLHGNTKCPPSSQKQQGKISVVTYTGELGYDGPLYDRFLHMTDDMLGPSPMHIKYMSYVYN